MLLALALVMIGRTTGSGWTMVIVSGLAGALGAAALWPAVALRRVESRLGAPRDAVCGRPMDLSLEVTGPRTSLVVTVALGYRDAASSFESASDRSWTEVPGAGNFVCSPSRRGVVDRIRLELKCAAPLGLVWWRRSVEAPLDRPIDVAPTVTPSAVPTISEGEGGDRHRPERRSGHDSVRTVRDYVPGDATRLVHWGLTARRDQLTVKELEDPEGALLAIVLDLRGDPLVAEKLASRAAGLCTAGLRSGVEVALCTAEESGPVTGRVSSPTVAGRRLARAVAGPPGTPPRSARVVRLP
ncbi:MAG TPA: DUF58 domain-containing protein [Acidimicrobiales bacterium]|nr:DUF58 domain-containing protein [Acidimicrobiales bacterium]